MLRFRNPEPVKANRILYSIAIHFEHIRESLINYYDADKKGIVIKEHISKEIHFSISYPEDNNCSESFKIFVVNRSEKAETCTITINNGNTTKEVILALVKDEPFGTWHKISFE